jgi:hypothetical protein
MGHLLAGEQIAGGVNAKGLRALFIACNPYVTTYELGCAVRVLSSPMGYSNCINGTDQWPASPLSTLMTQ